MRRPISAHFLRFALIGAAGTALHFAVLMGLVQWADADAVVASQVGAVVGATTNYGLNRCFNYRTAAAHRTTAPKFLLVVLVGFVLNGLCMSALVHGWGWNYVVAQVVTTALVLGWNFAANHFWTFAESQ